MDNQLATVKALLNEAESDYFFAFARGDWETCATAKAAMAKHRKKVAKIIKQQLKPSFA